MSKPPRIPDATTCEHCRWFERDKVNPREGMGRCTHAHRHGYFYPAQAHRCADHKQEATDERKPA